MRAPYGQRRFKGDEAVAFIESLPEEHKTSHAIRGYRWCGSSGNDAGGHCCTLPPHEGSYHISIHGDGSPRPNGHVTTWFRDPE